MTEQIWHFKYVPHGFVHVWEKAGWVVMPHVFRNTHHGEYSECMQWAGEGEPVCPQIEAVAS